jgi:antitoxin ParD1/3/4
MTKRLESAPLIQEREARLAALDASIARGLADVDAGRVKPSADVFDRLEAKLAQEPVYDQETVPR